MTPRVGRNDPCPCGSGKKFEKCCLGKDAEVRFTRDDRNRATDRIADFALRPEFDDDRLTAIVAFWSDWVEAHGEEEGRPAMELEESIQAFALWFALDVRLARGATVLELMLRREMASLSPGAQDTRSEMQLADVRNLLRSAPEIDRSYIEQWTARLGLEPLYREVSR